MEEILHQLIGSLSHYSQGYIHPRRCRISSINSIIADSIEKKHTSYDLSILASGKIFLSILTHQTFQVPKMEESLIYIYIEREREKERERSGLCKGNPIPQK